MSDSYSSAVHLLHDPGNKDGAEPTLILSGHQVAGRRSAISLYSNVRVAKRPYRQDLQGCRSLPTARFDDFS